MAAPAPVVDVFFVVLRLPVTGFLMVVVVVVVVVVSVLRGVRFGRVEAAVGWAVLRTRAMFGGLSESRSWEVVLGRSSSWMTVRGGVQGKCGARCR